MRAILLVQGIAFLAAYHAAYLWRYFNLSEWWRCNVSWSIGDLIDMLSRL